jgi:hypothetical protein
MRPITLRTAMRSNIFAEASCIAASSGPLSIRRDGVLESAVFGAPGMTETEGFASAGLAPSRRRRWASRSHRAAGLTRLRGFRPVRLGDRRAHFGLRRAKVGHARSRDAGAGADRCLIDCSSIEVPLLSPGDKHAPVRNTRRLQRPLHVCAVTRRRFPVGASPARPTAPAGSNPSSHGGNEMAEAFGVAGHV